MGHENAEVEVERRPAPVLQRELAEAHRADVMEQRAQLALDDVVMLGSGHGG